MGKVKSSARSNIPPKVWITPKVSYKVFWAPKGSLDTEKHRNRGECDPVNKLIYLEEGLSSKKTRETFTHEWMHAMEHEYKIKIPHALVFQLERPLSQVLKLNGWT